jgi:hypothetical protein
LRQLTGLLDAMSALNHALKHRPPEEQSGDCEAEDPSPNHITFSQSERSRVVPHGGLRTVTPDRASSGYSQRTERSPRRDIRFP